MRRRDFLILTAGVVGGRPTLARAQQKTTPVIGILAAAASDNAAALRNLAAFREGLGEFGYVEGQSVAIEYRWAAGHFDRLPGLAADLVDRKVDVIVTEGGDPSVLAAKQVTSTIPVVFHTDGDPVARGLVASLARPGGNLTGIALHELAAKRIELLCDLVPEAKAIAFLVNPINPNADDEIRDAQEATRVKGVQLHVVTANSDREIEPAFATISQLRAGGLLVGNDVVFSNNRAQLLALASHHAIPAIYGGRLAAEAGGLLAYGSNFPAMYHQKGIYTGKILKGAKPADLPVEQPSKIELVATSRPPRSSVSSSRR